MLPVENLIHISFLYFDFPTDVFAAAYTEHRKRASEIDGLSPRESESRAAATHLFADGRDKAEQKKIFVLRLPLLTRSRTHSRLFPFSLSLTRKPV